MPVKIIGLIRLKDPAAFDTYRNQVGATVERHGGSIVARGAVGNTYWNELPCAPFEACVELSFPTAEAADRWADSREYRAIVPVREQAMDLLLFRVD